MSSGRLQRKHAKAVRRRRMVAERGRGEGAGQGMAAVARRAATAPIVVCMVQQGIFEAGVGVVVIARDTPADGIVVGTFLLDVFCLGVKDAALRVVDSIEFNEMMGLMNQSAPLEAVAPAYARKLVRDAGAYGRSLGIEQHPDMASAELLFGGVSADSSDAVFSFGREGRPAYIPGPGESASQIRRRVERLRRKLGEGGFDYMPAEFDDLSEAFDESELEGGYDPEVEPDAASWLALDDGARQILVGDWHVREGMPEANVDIHATMHVIIENQIAEGDETVRRTVARLAEAEGLGRHDALHTVIVVLMKHIGQVRQGKAFQLAEYHAALERLTARDWLALQDTPQGGAIEGAA